MKQKLASKNYAIAITIIMLVTILNLINRLPAHAFTDEEAIKNAALLQIEQQPELLRAGYEPFQVGELHIAGSWAFLNLFSNPTNVESETHLVVPDVVLATAIKDENGEWRVVLESDAEFKSIVSQLPDELLSPESKNILSTAVTFPQSSNALYNFPGLPWAVNSSWRYNQGPHGGTQDALDFGTPNQTSDTVRAADAGVVMYRTETCMGLRRSDNLRIWYQHLRPEDIAGWTVGANVSLNQVLGMTTTASGCGGYSTGHHVHVYADFSGQPVSASNISWNGWEIQGSNLYKCGQTVSPNGSNILHSPTTGCPDTTPPSLAITAPANNTWYTTNQTLSWTVSDGGTGPAYSKWGWNDSTPDNQVNGSTGSTTLSAAGEGQHTLYVQAWDNAGNATGVESRGWFGYDVTAPTNPTSVNAGCTAVSGIWQNSCTDPAFTWSGAADGSGSGVKDDHVYWGTDPAGTPNIWRSTADFNPSAITTSGGIATYYLRVAARDNVGHEAAPKTLFILRYDNSMPAGNPLINNNAVTVNNINVLVQPQGSDTGSGIAKVRLSNNGTTWQALTPGTAVPWSLLGNNRDWNPVWVQLEDGVGNRSAIYELQTCLDLYPASPSSSSYRLWSGGLAAAGGQGSSTSFRLTDTVGQTASGSLLSSSSYRLQSGFGGGTAVPGSAAYQPFQCGQSGPVYLPMVIRP